MYAVRSSSRRRDHCRIGSLEIVPILAALGSRRSLPHRQLRKLPIVLGLAALGSLPHRQLRKDHYTWKGTECKITAA